MHNYALAIPGIFTIAYEVLNVSGVSTRPETP
jgi:hypothetical protein